MSNTSLINSLISKHGSTQLGSKTLSELRDSIDNTLEKGTALITATDISEGCPGILLYPDGPFEVMSPTMQHAYMKEHEPTILLLRTLQSLDGVPTHMSKADYKSLENMTLVAKTKDEVFDDNITEGGYDKALDAVMAARLTQLEDEDEEHHGMFKLDLSSVPFSIQSRRLEWSVNERPGSELLPAWAWSQVEEQHEKAPSKKLVHLELKNLKSLRPSFLNTTESRAKLRTKIIRIEEANQSLYEIEGICGLDNTPVGRHTHLMEFTPHEDEISKRFQRTVDSTPDRDRWLYDSFMASAVKRRELSEMETQALIPPKLLEQFSRATDEKLCHSAYRGQRGVSKRPSDYIKHDDEDFRRWMGELATASPQGNQPLAWPDVPREGHERLLSDVALILDGEGPEVSSRRYGEDTDVSHSATIAQEYDNINPLEYFLLKSHGESNLGPKELEDEMPPAAYEKWAEVKADWEGYEATEGKNDVRSYRKYLAEASKAVSDARSVTNQLARLDVAEVNPAE
ncbi:hypothetical protein L202_03821 [Cryptococcus amylolentus CBS 6039]|uniref:Uncharacterized protein n=1 Tax=Cryptococcus amylolentus CBS 6039 TaxID=1295533 RepID=A0A1E3HUB4_9TREE|nr:hypothetical protein L202_03821 [Cryptococcus amylolentus CBS 6039]ODN79939.1 hypothetical protein L202_03821 [Cryptococcus amylolentus CBS 6039]